MQIGMARTVARLCLQQGSVGLVPAGVGKAAGLADEAFGPVLLLPRVGESIMTD
jgi:hypothetical protein